MGLVGSRSLKACSRSLQPRAPHTPIMQLTRIRAVRFDHLHRWNAQIVFGLADAGAGFTFGGIGRAAPATGMMTTGAQPTKPSITARAVCSLETGKDTPLVVPTCLNSSTLLHAYHTSQTTALERGTSLKEGLCPAALVFGGVLGMVCCGKRRWKRELQK